jgi:cysteine synthase A
MSEELPNAWLPLQFDNPPNIEIHKTTAQEIIKDFPDGLDYMITGVGTVVISSCAQILKQHYPNLKVLP